MGKVREPDPVKLFVGILTSDPALLVPLRLRLEAVLGPVDLVGPLLDFDYTRYYEAEMGPALKRQFWSFAHLVAPDALPGAKLLTNDIEQEFAIEGKRRVNLDPGYLAEAKLVLATTKDYAHRLYLGHGIFGEVTLIYRRGEFVALPWTYPDYRSEEYLGFFLELRAVYRRQIRGMAGRASSPPECH